MKKKRPSKAVLLAGCAGFIGSKVCQLLLQDGHTVMGLDNLNDAYDTRLKEWRLGQMQGYPHFHFHQNDITDREAIGKLFEDARQSTGPPFDAVIHLAARAGVRQSLEDPWVYYRTNVEGTLNLLDLCRKHQVGKFVLASTSSLYGSQHSNCGMRQRFAEELSTDRTLSPYSASKKAAETLSYTYHYLYGLDVTILRYFTVYGPAGRPDMSIFRFIHWIASGEPLILYDDGTQERDFTYVDDIARGTVLALMPSGYEIINLGSDHPVPLSRVIDLLEKQIGKKARVERHEAQAADVRATWANIDKARRLLGWEPATSLQLGLERTIAWYQENRAWVKDLQL